jgi:hypothetical protein
MLKNCGFIVLGKVPGSKKTFQFQSLAALLSQRPEAHPAERHGAVLPLQQDGARFVNIGVESAARGAVREDILQNL